MLGVSEEARRSSVEGPRPVASEALEDDPVAWILGRESSATFVAEELGRQWVHARSDEPDRFASLLTLADLDEVLGRYGVRHPSIKLVRSDGSVPTSEYLWRDRMVDPGRVAQLFTEGATVIFGALHDRHEPARTLCSAVARQVSARTQTNVYLTPPSSQGFKPHWDTHDVFVLQIEGSKTWRFYGGGPELPLRDQKFDPDRHEPGEVEADLTLRAGEALYIPRGVMHAAATTDTLSLHITLGVMSYTWADLLADCLSEVVERSPEWRERMPFGFARDGAHDGALASALAARLSELAGQVDLEAVVRERADTFTELLRPRAGDYLREASTAAEVGPTEIVAWRSGVPGRIEARGERVGVVSGGREIELPSRATRMLERLLGGGPVPAGEVDAELDWPSHRVVLAALIREGWVARVERPSAP